VSSQAAGRQAGRHHSYFLTKAFCSMRMFMQCNAMQCLVAMHAWHGMHACSVSHLNQKLGASTLKKKARETHRTFIIFNKYFKNILK